MHYIILSNQTNFSAYFLRKDFFYYYFIFLFYILYHAFMSHFTTISHYISLIKINHILLKKYRNNDFHL